MEKVTINNEVVLMRKFVKQAKIRAINGYTKEIRKLQNRKGSDDATSKFKRKAERLLAKVAILRKIQPDTVSRKALAKEKDWKAVLKEKNIPLEDQCYALLANYAAVQSEVERFHKKYWDLVPKIPAFFKDWEEKSKDPISKQEKKKAKQLRKSMKNVKLDKNNPNAIPVSLKTEADVTKNKSSPNKNSLNNVNIPTKFMPADKNQSKNEVNENDSKSISLTVVGNNASIKEDISNNKTKEGKVILGFPKKSQLQVKYKQLKPAENLLNNVEKIKYEEKSSGADNSYEIEKEMNSEEDINSDEEGMNSEEDVNSDEEVNSGEEDVSSDEEVNSGEEDVNSDEEVNSNKEGNSDEEEKNSDKEEFGKSLLKFNPNESTKIKNKDIKMSSENDEDSYSEEYSDLEKNEAISESDSDLKSEVTETINKKFNMPKSNTKSANNPQDIRSRLQALADNKLKSDIKRKRQKKTNSSKPVQENKLKAVAMLNLNELLGLDEFSVEKSNNVVEETGETKRKKDPFFLGKGGEVISESGDEDSPNPFQAKDQPAFKKKKVIDFGKNSNGDLFKRKSFPTDSPQNPRSGFKEKNFTSNKRSSNFEDGNNSFKNRGQRRFDLKNKGFQNKSFGEKMPSKQFKPNDQQTRNKDNFSKNKSNITSNKNPVDDKPLHPSWEAKKKLKEAANSKFQGKRIVFDN